MNKNSGYIGWSMSRRAGEAYSSGLAPLSKIGGSVYIRAAAEFLGPAERHHTSKYCNLTPFYSRDAVVAIAAQLKAARDKNADTLRRRRADREARHHFLDPISSSHHFFSAAAELQARAARYFSLAEGEADAALAEMWRARARELLNLRRERIAERRHSAEVQL